MSDIPAGHLKHAWLDMKTFAALAGIAPRLARNVCKASQTGAAWRGASLSVCKQGNAWEVYAPSLPAPLYEAWRADLPNPPAPLAESPPAQDPMQDRPAKLARADDIQSAKWAESLILSACAYPKGSHARGSVIKDIAGREHVGPDGKPRRVTARTLTDWITRYERKGLAGLVRKRRHEARPRVILSRAWDAACPLPMAQQTAIAEAIQGYIRGLWAEANPKWQKAELLTACRLSELCRNAGWAEVTQDLCRLGRHAIERHKHFALVHTARKDAKRFSDLYKPRIIRGKPQRPMEIVVGDVHPVDITLARADGNPYTPRLIAWYDWANHRIFGTLVHLGKGQGVTQRDVWASFAAMVQAWGLPERLYLDNGKEYHGRKRGFDPATLSGLVRGFNELSALVINLRQFTAEIVSAAAPQPAPEQDTPAREAAGIVRAMPYNAAAKPVEGAFSALEKVLSLLPGYIGGNRMEKRAPALGKQTAPWGDIAAFERAFSDAMAFYHDLPQSGALDGLSPNQAFAAQHAEGWQAVHIPPLALVIALSEARLCKVHNRGVLIDGDWYEGDALIPLRQQKIRIRYAQWAPERVLYLPNDHELAGAAWIELAPIYHPMDEAGAIEQARKQGIMRRHVNALAAQAPALDMPAELARHAASQPPAPAVIFGPAVNLGAGVQALADAGQRSGPPPAQTIRTLKPEEVIDPETGKVRNLLDNLPQPNPMATAQAPHDPFAGLLERYAGK